MSNPQTPTPPPDPLIAVFTNLTALLAESFDTWACYSTPPNQVTGDSLFLTLNSLEYDYTAGQTAQIDITATALARVSEPETTWRRLAELLTPLAGIKAALITDRTLSGVAQLARVTRARLAAPTDFGDAEYATAEFDIEVLL